MRVLPTRAVLALAGLGLAAGYYNGLDIAAKPPLGWSTWCTDDYCGLLDLCFEEEIREIADAMVSSGMRDAGYWLVLLDDCWADTSRDPVTGALRPDPARFPSGIPALVDYLKARNLTLGLYTCAGTLTCKFFRPGSWGHYDQDAQTFVDWGVGYVKMDNCNTNHTEMGPPHQYFANFSASLNKTGVPTWFATCEWGEDDVESWGPTVAQSFRIGPDHLPLWSFNGQGVADYIERMATPGIGNVSRPYGWADPDFLETGLFPLSHVESETEWAFWAMFGGSMIITTDVRNMSEWKAGLVLNSDILAVNQDAALIPGYRIANNTALNTQVWMKPLANGDVAVTLFNRDDWNTQTVAVTWAQLGWSAPGATVRVYDLFARQVVAPAATGGWNATLAPHATAFYRLTKTS